MRVGVDARHLTAGRGVARYTRALLGALAAAYPEDEWLAFVPGRDRLRGVPAGVRVVRHALPGRVLFGAAAVARRPRLDRLLGGVDVVWAPAPAPLALSAGVPLVLSVHDRSFEERPRDFTAYERAWHRLARPRALAVRAAAVVCDADAVRADIARAWGVDATVVSPGPLLDRTERARARAAVNGGTPYLLFVGALEPRKAPELLAAAHQRARGVGLQAELWFAGSGRVAVAGNGIRRLGTPRDEELASLYSGALALVMPSWLEGFGLPPLEAAACGTPSIVSDLAVYDETLGANVVRVPRGNEVALAGALLRMEREPRARAELAEAAHHAVAPLTWARAARETHAVLAGAACSPS